MDQNMNVNALIDAIVRQTTVLIAQLATAAGVRAPLAHVANEVFTELVRELREQGLGHKVIADMFGLSLRTYHNQVSRLSEAKSERGRSLWVAVLSYMQQREVTPRAQVMEHFRRDDEVTVRGVLRDLTDSGLVYRTGKGDAMAYRVAQPQEQTQAGADPSEVLASLLWVTIHRFGPLERSELLAHVPTDDAALEAALAALLDDGRVRRVHEGDTTRYGSDGCVIPLGDEAGWEAAVFDHFQAMVTAVSAKLHSGASAAHRGEAIGGSTYTYDITRAHPLYEETLAFLQRTREQAVDLRKRVERYNADHPIDPDQLVRVIAYVGQTLVRDEPGSEPEALP